MADRPLRQNKYQRRFREEMRRLDARQRAAVRHIEGPVLVVAGPGTGKTHVLACRVGYILQETDALPANILCLTFTDAAAFAMRRRLAEFMGPTAHQVHIFTFHSFCNHIIQNNLDRLGGIQDLEPLSDLERVDLLRSLLDELPPAHPLRQGYRDPYFHLPHLQHLFRAMKAENWTPDLLEEEARQYLQSLPERPEFQYRVNTARHRRGQPKQHLLDREARRMELLLAGARLFERYNQRLQQTRRYDYEDMLHGVLQAFQTDIDFLREYQEQYLYFLVDEYQDTNGTQNALLQTLIDYWEVPNVFVVGDDDQSIYEFQGA
ncbi:MAG: ATP-dependent helicase, partial [Bacteroidetes bacterium]